MPLGGLWVAKSGNDSFNHLQPHVAVIRTLFEMHWKGTRYDHVPHLPQPTGKDRVLGQIPTV